jgi:hypothetical protein
VACNRVGQHTYRISQPVFGAREVTEKATVASVESMGGGRREEGGGRREEGGGRREEGGGRGEEGGGRRAEGGGRREEEGASV